MAIYKQGFNANEAKPLITQDLLLQAIVALIVLLVLIFIYSKRDRILNLGKEKEKEIEINAWKER